MFNGRPLKDADLRLVQERWEEKKRYYELLHGLSPEDASDRACKCLFEASGAMHDSVVSKRADQRKWIKDCCRKLVASGETLINSRKAMAHAFENFGYDPKESKGLGDTIGRGNGGLYLKQVGKTKEGGNLYQIPDPELFSDWYEHDIPLPNEYYGNEYLDQLEVLETRKSRSTFFEERIQYAQER